MASKEENCSHFSSCETIKLVMAQKVKPTVTLVRFSFYTPTNFAQNFDSCLRILEKDMFSCNFPH